MDLEQTSKDDRIFNYDDRNRLKEYLEAKCDDLEFIAIIRKTLFGDYHKSGPASKGDNTGDVVDFNKLDDLTCYKLYRNLVAYGIPWIGPAQIQFVKDKEPAVAELQKKKKQRARLKNYDKPPAIVDSSSLQKSTVKLTPGDRATLRRVMAYVEGIRRFAAASILKWEKPERLSKGQCLVLFDFDRSLKWVPKTTKLPNGLGGPRIDTIESAKLLEPSQSGHSIGNLKTDIFYRLPNSSFEVGTGDSVVVFNKPGEVQAIAAGVTPSQCFKMIQLLKCLDHITLFEKQLERVELKLKRGKFNNAQEVIVALRMAFVPLTKEPVFESLIITSVMEGCWTQILRDALGGGIIRMDQKKEIPESTVKRAKDEWKKHNFEADSDPLDGTPSKRAASSAENGDDTKRAKADEDDNGSDSDMSNHMANKARGVVKAQKTGRLVWAQTDAFPGSWPAETCVPDKSSLSLVKPDFPGRFVMVLYFANLDAGEQRTWDPLPVGRADSFQLHDMEEKFEQLPTTDEDPFGACLLFLIARARELGFEIPTHQREIEEEERRNEANLEIQKSLDLTREEGKNDEADKAEKG
mmetsp:Transcript_14241/g.20140  ORF Transcript_14241/g.20140 Transcript_14241/m.20140 type:complete len:579 (+) Transcript_14241:23-1759(+)